MKTTGTPWPNILADLESKREAIVSLIDLVRTHFVGDDPTSMPESPRAPAPKPRKTNGRTTDASKAPRHRDAEAVPDGELSAAIIATLKKHGSQSPGDLARLLKWDVSVLRYRVKPLLKAHTIIGTGATINRLLSLPGKPPAKEGL